VKIGSGSTWQLRSNPTTGTNSYGFDIVQGVGSPQTRFSIASTGQATFQASIQEKVKLIASSDEYLSLAFANNSGTTQWEISKGNSNELYFYRGGGGVDQAIKLNISSTGLAKFTPTGGNLSGAVNALHLKNTGTAAGDGTVILFTAGASSDGAAIKSTGRIFNGSDLTFFTGGSAAANARLTISTGGEITVKKSITTEGLITDSSFPIYKSKLSGAYTGGWGSLAVGTVLGGLQHSHVRTDGGQVNIAAAIDFLLANNTYGTGQSEISFKCGGVNGVDSTEKVRIESDGVIVSKNGIEFQANSLGAGQTGVASSGSGGDLRFYTNGTQSVTVESGGVLTKNGDSSSARIIPVTDNAGYLGESSHRWQAVYAVNGSIQTSDRNEKTLITTSDLGLNFILKLEPVSYKWKVGGWNIEENGEDEEPTKTPIDGKRNHYGLIAQQVKEVIGDKDFGGWVKEDLEDDASMESLRYAEFISPMIKAIQEQQTIIEDLKLRIETLEG